MADSGAKGLSRIIKAMAYSWQGLKVAYENEAAFRQELLLAAILITPVKPCPLMRPAQPQDPEI